VARRSPAHFFQSFKRTLGETPHTYIKRRRVDQIGADLTGDAPRSEIAMLYGFSDPAHFCNRFRDVMGNVPAAWRRDRRENARIAPLVRPPADTKYSAQCFLTISAFHQARDDRTSREADAGIRRPGERPGTATRPSR
jgi:AraC-like DNA-binding protein